MIELSKHSTRIFTHHGAVLRIAKQTLLLTSSTYQLNLMFIWASKYLQRFNIEICHKLGKKHIVSNTLSQLAFANFDIKPASIEAGLDMLFIFFLVQINLALKKKS